jgi:hypothetical protein
MLNNAAWEYGIMARDEKTPKPFFLNLPPIADQTVAAMHDASRAVSALTNQATRTTSLIAAMKVG